MIFALDGATESSHMNHPDFRVNGRIFASLSPDDTLVNMKITPANLDLLMRQDPDTFKDVWGGRWLGVTLSRVSRPVLRSLLHDAWSMTVAQPRRATAQTPGRRDTVDRKKR
jgi:hypothetical protein